MSVSYDMDLDLELDELYFDVIQITFFVKKDLYIVSIIYSVLL